MKSAKTVSKVIWAGGVALALGIATLLPGTSNAADQVKGAQKLMQLKPVKTSDDIAALKPGDAVVMSCPKCKTINVAYVETTKGHIQEEKTRQQHLCPGCQTTIQVQGVGKAAKDEVKHVCQKCGSEDALCCVLKKGSGPTPGMEEKK